MTYKQLQDWLGTLTAEELSGPIALVEDCSDETFVVTGLTRTGTKPDIFDRGWPIIEIAV